LGYDDRYIASDGSIGGNRTPSFASLRCKPLIYATHFSHHISVTQQTCAALHGCSPKSFRSSNREAIKYRYDGSPLIGPEKRKKKAIRTARCLSAASFGLFRFFLSIAGSGQSSGSPSFGYSFLAKQEK
jgi:hypothetical protein